MKKKNYVGNFERVYLPNNKKGNYIFSERLERDMKRNEERRVFG